MWQMQETTTECLTNHGTSNNDCVCPVCGGTGWDTYLADVLDYGAIPVSILYAKICPRCKIERRMCDNTGIPNECCDNDISKIKWDIYGRDMSKLRKICTDFVANYKQRWFAAGKGIYLWSSVPGSGKTHIATALARSVMIQYDIQMRFILAADYIAMIGESIRRQQVDDLTTVYRTCDLLVLDDVGTGKAGDWQMEQMFRLINTRANNGLVTVYTSNCPIDKIATIDERCKSRILRNSIVLQMPEVSIRNKQAQEQQEAFLRDILDA